MASERTTSILDDEERLHEMCVTKWFPDLFPKGEKRGEEEEEEEERIIRLNHGSFGAAPEPVQRSTERYRALWRRNPDELYLHKMPQILHQNTALVQQVIGAERVEQVALVDNTTTAVAIVANTLAWQLVLQRPPLPSFVPVVVLFSNTYAAVKYAFQATLHKAGARLHYVPVPFPLPDGPAPLIELLTTTLQTIATQTVIPESTSTATGESEKEREREREREREGIALPQRVVLTVIDYVSSVPSLVMPIKELMASCRAHAPHSKIFIDGAHAIGQVPIRVGELDTDFLCSNIHKWGLAATGAAFLYTRNPEAEQLCHPIISHNHGQGTLREAMWTGTRDMSPLLSIHEALSFIAGLGGLDKLAARNKELLRRARHMLAAAWHSPLVVPDSLCASLAMVALPQELHFADAEVAPFRFRALLRRRYRIEIVVMALPPRGYLRVSCQIYNTWDDYLALRDAVLDIVRTNAFATLPAQDADTDIAYHRWFAPPGPVPAKL